MSAQSTAARFVDADPRELIVGANARKDPRLTKAFKASIRDRGVLQAVTAYRDGQDRLVVLFGQCRTVAAVEVGRPTIPVMVVDRPDEVDRIGDQVVENDQRTELGTGDRIAAFAQMAAFGVSAAQIAKRTGHDRTDVDTALTVAGSELASKASQRYDFLTLDQAAVIAEFEDDPEAVKSLMIKAKEGRGFDHRAQQLRDKRTENAERQAAEAELTAAGLTVVPEPSYGDTNPPVGLHRLTDAAGEQLTPDNHQQCPGHAAYVTKEWQWVEVAADEPDHETDDPDEEYDEDEDDEVPAGHQPRRRQVLDWTAKYVCADFRQHGHQERTYSSTSKKKTAADMTDEERETARAKRQDVIQSNKDWISATTVRREWLRTLLTRKSAPKGAAQFVAASMARVTLDLAKGYGLAYELLGITGQPPGYGRPENPLADLIAKVSDARAQVISLALVLAAWEEPLKVKDMWRTTSRDPEWYLRFLESCKYDLSPIELRACGETPQPSGQAESGSEEIPAE